MGHDQLFKTLLETFLQEFLELFFPEVAARLDFSSQRPLDKEFFTDLPDGLRREADVVAEVRTLAGEPELVLVHVEVQSRSERSVGQRMFEYYSLLRLRYNVPVLPVVLYLTDGPSEHAAEYREELFGQEWLSFRYATVSLARRLAREYVETSPLGAALSALMQRDRRRAAVLRADMLKRVVESELDEARQYLLVNVVEPTFR